METFNQESLRQLASVSGGPCVSMFVPARRMGANAAIDTSRVKSMMRAIESEVVDGRYGTVGIPLLEPLRDLLAERSVWRESEQSLAVFLAPGMIRTFRVPVQLEESAVVADRFDIVPLLSLGVDDGEFLLLSLSQNHIRLFRGMRQKLEVIELVKPLMSLDEFMRFVAFEKQPQIHSGARKVPGRRSKQSAVFHGTGSAASRRKEDLAEFFRAVDHKVSHIAGTADMPLLLAGVDHVKGIYRNVSRYPHIIEAQIGGNIDRMPLNALHTIGWILVEPYFKRRSHAAVEKFHSQMGTGLASADPRLIDAAAADGRIETLFVTTASGLPRADGEEMALSDTEKSRLIAMVLSTGGRVYPAGDDGISTRAGIAAIMRY
jgi:hypothetical protein